MGMRGPADRAGARGVPRRRLRDALTISDPIFGEKVDLAYGAYQRGYYPHRARAAPLPRAREGDANAQTLIAEIYANGLGVPEDSPPPASWYQHGQHEWRRARHLRARHARTSRAPASPRIASAPPNCSRPPPTPATCTAKYNLGLLHVEGALCRAQPHQGRRADWRSRQFRHHPKPATTMPACWWKAPALPPTAKAAAEQFRLAAEDGLVAAQVEYATILYLGQGVPVERAASAASRGTQRAADGGNAVAQNRYAKLLAVGEGVTRPISRTAAMYRALARRQGLKDRAARQAAGHDQARTRSTQRRGARPLLAIAAADQGRAAAPPTPLHGCVGAPANYSPTPRDRRASALPTRQHLTASVLGHIAALPVCSGPPRAELSPCARRFSTLWSRPLPKPAARSPRISARSRTCRSRLKGPADFVSNADKPRRGRSCFSELQKARPRPGPSSARKALEVTGTDGQHRWIVDPLDGTTNFLHGIPMFAVAIALETQQRDRRSAIFNPAMEELFTAEKAARRLAE